MEDTLKEHIIYEHKKIEKISCKMCNKNFNDEMKLNKHIYKNIKKITNFPVNLMTSPTMKSFATIVERNHPRELKY